MSTWNKVILIGHLGRDGEFNAQSDGRERLNLSMATNRVWRNAQGEWESRADWHRVVAWGPVARDQHERMKKGRQVLVEGSLRTRSFQDKEGRDRYITEVHAHRLKLLGRDGEATGVSQPEDEELAGAAPF